MRPVRFRISTELSAFRSPEWSLRTPHSVVRPLGLSGAPGSVPILLYKYINLNLLFCLNQ
jgi:hypothetical protein